MNDENARNLGDEVAALETNVREIHENWKRLKDLSTMAVQGLTRVTALSEKILA